MALEYMGSSPTSYLRSKNPTQKQTTPTRTSQKHKLTETFRVHVNDGSTRVIVMPFSNEHKHLNNTPTHVFNTVIPRPDASPPRLNLGHRYLVTCPSLPLSLSLSHLRTHVYTHTHDLWLNWTNAIFIMLAWLVTPSTCQ